MDVGDIQSSVEGNRAGGGTGWLLKRSECEGFLKLKIGGLAAGGDEVSTAMRALGL